MRDFIETIKIQKTSTPAHSSIKGCYTGLPIKICIKVLQDVGYRLRVCVHRVRVGYGEKSPDSKAQRLSIGAKNSSIESILSTFAASDCYTFQKIPLYAYETAYTGKETTLVFY